MSKKSSITVEQAWEIIRALPRAKMYETLPIAKSHGRVLAGEIRAKRSHPWTDISAVDGYAYLHSNTRGVLKLVGVAKAGKAYAGKPVQRGECVRIMTGALIPEGCDCVAYQEDCSTREIVIKVPELNKGDNIRKKGRDVFADTQLKKPRSMIAATDIAAGLATNVEKVTVFPKISIQLLATGSELRAAGSNVEGGTVNAIMPAIAALLQSGHTEITDAGICRDTTRAMIPRIVQMQTQAELLIFSGGVSVGDRDLVRQSIESLGAEILFHGVNMKPGKPSLLAKLGDSYVLALPGNPVSSLVCAHILAKPLIRHLAGMGTIEPVSHSALAIQEMSVGKNRTEFCRGQLAIDRKARAVVKRHVNQDSAALHTLSQANCLIRLEPDNIDRLVGDQVQIYPL